MELKGTTEISGSVTGMPGGVLPIKDGKLDGENLSFFIVIDFQGNPVKIVYKGKVNGGEIRFTLGTEDGIYTVQFRSNDDELVAEVVGAAAWNGTAEVLKIRTDLRGVPSGAYMIAIRSESSSLRSYQVVLE